MRAKSVVPVVVLQRSITTITAPLLLLPNTTTSHHCCSPLLLHRNKNSSKNYPINRSGMLLTSSFDLWGQISNLSAIFWDQLRLAALFFEGKERRNESRRKKKGGGRKERSRRRHPLVFGRLPAERIVSAHWEPKMRAPHCRRVSAHAPRPANGRHRCFGFRQAESNDSAARGPTARYFRNKIIPRDIFRILI